VGKRRLLQRACLSAISFYCKRIGARKGIKPRIEVAEMVVPDKIISKNMSLNINKQFERPFYYLSIYIALLCCFHVRIGQDDINGQGIKFAKQLLG
jgi:hypothetical protein